MARLGQAWCGLVRMRIEKRLIISTDEWLSWRRGDVTAHNVAALVGMHPRETIYGLWSRVTGAPLPDDEDNLLMKRGRRYELLIGEDARAKHPTWKITKNKFYYRDPARRLGATPDFLIRTGDGHRGVLQAKTVVPQIFKQYWSEDDCPLWIKLQVLLEMILTRSSFGIVGALVIGPYNDDYHEYPIPRHEGAEERILRAAEKFWRDIDAGRMPEPDYAKDGRLIAAMNPHTTKGKQIDLRHDNELPELLDKFEKAKAECDQAEARKEELQTEIKAKIGDAEYAIVDGWKVSLKEISKREHVVRATTYRQLRIVREEPAAHEIEKKGEAA
jgi:predicted phage-related endonuclease